jgi:nickel transport protein
MPETRSSELARAHYVYACFALAVGLASLAPPAAAHDYWIERSGDGYTLFQGHVYSSHKGEERVPYDPTIVKRVACARAEGDITTLEPARAYPVRVLARCSAVLIEVSSGYWTQTLTETIQKPKTEVRGALRGWRSEEAVKRIDVWTPRLAQPLSDGLELMPREDPFGLKPGDKLRLLVTWRGRPRRGVAVAYDGNARGVTGADGQANILIRHGGVQTLSASFEEAVQDPLAEKVVRGTILQLDLTK